MCIVYGWSVTKQYDDTQVFALIYIVYIVYCVNVFHLYPIAIAKRKYIFKMKNNQLQCYCRNVYVSFNVETYVYLYQ